MPSSIESRIVLVTGASGFVGRAVTSRLRGAGWRVRAAVRQIHEPSSDVIAIGDINADTDWEAALTDVDCVVHLAARVHHQANGTVDDYWRTNTDGTLALVQAAVRHGVRRVVFVSTAKVLGDSSPLGRSLTERDDPHPSDAYAESKWRAEEGLRQYAGDIETVVLRPPLVYGPGVGANFRELLRYVAQGTSLPLAAVRNRRSFIYVQNLASAIELSLVHPNAIGMTFLVSDGIDFSTPELIRLLSQAMNQTPRLWSLPPVLLKATAIALGRRAQADRLLGSLALDTSLIRARLGWRPPYSADEALTSTARAFIESETQLLD
jgi:nucleoside-diphosphate-sugar epimerase